MKFELIIAAFLVGICAASLEVHEVTVTHNDETNVMRYEADKVRQRIYFHVPGKENFREVETLEDYKTNFAASRVNDEDACYIRQISNTMDEMMSKIRSSGPEPQPTEANVQLSAVPLDDSETIGEDLINFCGNLQMFKLTETESEVAPENRHLSGDRHYNHGGRPQSYPQGPGACFNNCMMFMPYTCYYTVIVLPTGTTIIFPFYGGFAPFLG